MPQTAALLARIADSLGLPVAAFTTPRASIGAPTVLEQVHGLLCDPDGSRLAASFHALPAALRRQLADAGDALVAAAAGGPGAGRSHHPADSAEPLGAAGSHRRPQP